ncbi:MAG TPA: alkaline phosphatase family protein [Thermoplasmata archaeon]|nr:alkaline phosphatase family protein [Thermoplasmata archaeon]
MADPRARTLVLGLDSVPPGILFDKFLPKMPNMQALLARSVYGTLKSCDPPITVPAWAVMFTGMDPGSLGIYGFRHRRPGTYWDTYAPTPKMLPHPPLWEILSRVGRRVAVIGMPPGYPPPRVNGIYISDFMTPDNAKDFVQPPELASEILGVANGYEFDVTFRADDRARIGEELIEMTRKRWAVARHLWRKERWDLFAIHEIGPDRIHHTFWKYFDDTHPRYEANPAYAALVDRYYRLLDESIGALLADVGDDVTVLVASDHGSQMMDGCFCINEWLLARGYLALKGPMPPRGTPIEKAAIDWSRTRAWGAGGYYARIFFNVKGREPNGVVAPAELPALTEALARELAEVRLPDGSPLSPDVRPPARIYREVRGDAPDLMIYFRDLKWRSAGTIGYGTFFLAENDTGPDDSVHSFDGVYALAEPGRPGAGPGPTESILDVAPTLLARMGVPVPPTMQGRPIPTLL